MHERKTMEAVRRRKRRREAALRIAERRTGWVWEGGAPGGLGLQGGSGGGTEQNEARGVFVDGD